MNNCSTGFFIWVVLISVNPLMPAMLEGQDRKIVQTIDILGLSAFSKEEILKEFVVKAGEQYSAPAAQRDLDLLRTKYRNLGYLQARVDSVVTDSTDGKIAVEIFFDEGKQSRIDTIRIYGNGSIPSERIRQNLSIGYGSPFVQEEIENGANRILNLYDQWGFPFTKITVENITVTEDSGGYRVGFTYAIREGRQVRIAELRVDGNTSTKSSVIVREARLTGSELYSEQLTETIKHRLEKMQLFSSVSLPELYLDQREQGGLLVKVQEGNPNRFDGVIGYVPPIRTGGSSYITGLVDLQFRNLFGTARRFAARWYREDQSTQELGLRYFEPWIASVPLNGEISLLQRIQDSTYVRRRIDLSADFLFSEEFAVGAVFSQMNIFPSEPYGKTVLAESRSTSIGISISYDTRNNVSTPSSGIYYRTEYDVGTKHSTAALDPSASENSTQRILLDLDCYFELVRNQVFAAEMHINDYRSNPIDVGDLFRLGGATTLRGYREGQFLGSRLVWSNLEYRFLVGQKSFLYGFVDLGYIVTPAEPSIGVMNSEQTKIGYGMGVRLDTKLGLIGVSIGLGEGDTFSTAKLHIRLINAF